MSKSLNAKVLRRRWKKMALMALMAVMAVMAMMAMMAMMAVMAAGCHGTEQCCSEGPCGIWLHDGMLAVPGAIGCMMTCALRAKHSSHGASGVWVSDDRRVLDRGMPLRRATLVYGCMSACGHQTNQFLAGPGGIWLQDDMYAVDRAPLTGPQWYMGE